MRVRWRLTKARHAAISFEVVEWSEELRSVISAWLGAVGRSVQVRLCTSGCKSEKTFGIISPPRDLLLSIKIIIIIIIKKNWRAAGLEPTTSAPSRMIVTDGNC